MSQGMDDLYKAFGQAKQAFDTLGLQRTLSGANQAVNQIRDSELKEEEKNAKLRQVAQQLTFKLAGQGVPASSIEQLANFAPKQATPQSAEQAVLFGTGDQQVRGQKLLDDKAQHAFDLRQAMIAGQLQGAQLRATQKADDKSTLSADQLLKGSENFSKFVQADNSVRSALGQSALNKQRAENLRTLLGGDVSEAALAKVEPQRLGELAIGMATLVKNGVASEGEVKLIYPETASLDKAKLATYLESGPQPANAAGFAKLYLKTIQREGAQAQSQLEDSVLQRANGHQFVKEAPADVKTKLSKILGISEDDIQIDGSKVSTPKSREFDTKFKSYSDGLSGLQRQALQGDPASADKLKKLGIDPKMSPRELANEIKFKINQGQW